LLYELKLLSTGGTRQFDTNAIINRYNNMIAVSVAADFLMLGQQRVGSYALSKTKTNTFAVALGAWLDAICGVINDHLVPRLFRLNGKPVTELPKLTHDDVETANLGELGTLLYQLSQAGFDLASVPDLLAAVLEKAGLPEPPETTDELDADPLEAEDTDTLLDAA
jgi:hypothetical protein